MKQTSYMYLQKFGALKSCPESGAQGDRLARLPLELASIQGKRT